MSKTTCPTCKGNKTQNLTVIMMGEEKQIPIKCISCEGSGEVTEQRLRAIKAAQDAWCSCNNPSGETDFYDDNQHPGCRKHHWRCHDCKKIVQVG